MVAPFAVGHSLFASMMHSVVLLVSPRAFSVPPLPSPSFQPSLHGDDELGCGGMVVGASEDVGGLVVSGGVVGGETGSLVEILVVVSVVNLVEVIFVEDVDADVVAAVVVVTLVVVVVVGVVEAVVVAFVVVVVVVVVVDETVVLVVIVVVEIVVVVMKLFCPLSLEVVICTHCNTRSMYSIDGKIPG